MKEYRLNANGGDFRRLRAPFMKQEEYMAAHRGLVVPCHDIFIAYKGGILLVKRGREPAKDLAWSLGGRIQRGRSIEESVKITAKKECNLDLRDITEIGYARFFCNADPYGHGCGSDCITFVYFARGYGKLKLDDFHSTPQIIKPEDLEDFQKHASPFIRDFMKKAMKYL